MSSTILGDAINRVDGGLKVRGAATYASDVTYPRLAHVWRGVYGAA
jgi:CO/xanthine dehydrogenase Mo-binding subunit